MYYGYDEQSFQPAYTTAEKELQAAQRTIRELRKKEEARERREKTIFKISPNDKPKAHRKFRFKMSDLLDDDKRPPIEYFDRFRYLNPGGDPLRLGKEFERLIVKLTRELSDETLIAELIPVKSLLSPGKGHLQYRALTDWACASGVLPHPAVATLLLPKLWKVLKPGEKVFMPTQRFQSQKGSGNAFSFENQLWGPLDANFGFFVHLVDQDGFEEVDEKFLLRIRKPRS